jgi:hypothetical protein
METEAPSLKTKAQSFYQKYHNYMPAAFFIGGVLFDIVTIGRIDDPLAIFQQGLYLLAATFILNNMFRRSFLPPTQSAPPGKIKAFYLKYEDEMFHFVIGALLSLYTLFYFKSSSLVASIGFMAILVFLMIANELKQFKGLGFELKYILLSLCYISFFCVLLPMLVGSISVWVFILSVLIGLLPACMIFYEMKKEFSDPLVPAKKILGPSAGVAALFLALYFLKLIPPVPLSINFIGVYHDVQKDQTGDYLLFHQRSWWRFWHNGDQVFLAKPDDKVFVFFRLFSPTNFSDEITLEWTLKDKNGRWQVQDRIPIRIVGGRAEGFRGYGVKSNYSAGDWRAHILTKDRREISRIGFEILASESPDTEYKIDRQ